MFADGPRPTSSLISSTIPLAPIYVALTSSPNIAVQAQQVPLAIQEFPTPVDALTGTIANSLVKSFTRQKLRNYSLTWKVNLQHCIFFVQHF